jgi:glycosyltransferase involved in cell wall biosynthesis
VVDALQGDLPVTKNALHFPGLLVARSCGLAAFYEDFERVAAAQWPTPRNWKSGFHIALGRLTARRTGGHPLQSLQCADLVALMNDDEFNYVSQHYGLGQRCRVFPGGLGESRLESFVAARRPAKERLAGNTVVFIGAWSPRKGSKDWGEIIRRVRGERPGAKFLFLGTGANEASVLRDLALPACDWIRIVPGFSSDELPRLMASATVGALPSYIEGFGFSVLEMLAAGLPVVAYDVPGPRMMLRDFSRPLMTPPGDTAKFASSLVSLLELDGNEYAALSEECQEVAGRFRWRDIAAETMGAYRDGLNRIAGSN